MLSLLWDPGRSFYEIGRFHLILKKKIIHENKKYKNTREEMSLAIKAVNKLVYQNTTIYTRILLEMNGFQSL